MNLVVGSTGLLGFGVCRQLLGASMATRALVRPTSDHGRIDGLREGGAELVEGDLKDSASLETAVAGVHCVISTATATASRERGDTIESVDLEGQLRLVEIARKARVRRFIFISFFPQNLEFPLQSAKRAVESALFESGMAYTILRPVNFMEIWLGPRLGFAPPEKRACIWGDGNTPTSWISTTDVARFAAGAVGNEKAQNRVFPVGGPHAYSQRAVLEIFGALGADRVSIEQVSMAELESALKNARGALEQSLAALKIGTALGQVTSSAAALEAIPIHQITVQSYAEAWMNQQRNLQYERSHHGG